MIILENIPIFKKLILDTAGPFSYSHLSFRFSKKHSATWAEVPLNRKSKRFSRTYKRKIISRNVYRTFEWTSK